VGKSIGTAGDRVPVYAPRRSLLLGVAVLFTGRFYPQLGGHVVLMVFAAAVVHVISAVTKRRPPEQRTYGPHVVGTLVALVLVALGVVAIGSPLVG